MTEKRKPILIARPLRSACVLCLTLVMLSGVTMAQHGNGNANGIGKGNSNANGIGKGNGNGNGNGNKSQVPEINAGSMSGAITLLGGGLLILSEKLRKRRSD